MDPLHQLQRLIAAGAWIQGYRKGGFGPKIALGAVEWIDNRGLLFAELGAEHQGHVHLIAASRLDLDGTMVDAYDGTGGLVATVHAMSEEEAAQAGLERWARATESEAWRRSWAAEVERIKNSAP